MAELSIFVHESGDFGLDSDSSVVVLVLHEQADSIAVPLANLTERLLQSGLNTDRAIHTTAAIRSEDVYRGMPLDERRREFTGCSLLLIPSWKSMATMRSGDHDPPRLPHTLSFESHLLRMLVTQ